CRARSAVGLRGGRGRALAAGLLLLGRSGIRATRAAVAARLRPRVGAVEARAVEGDADRAEDLAQGAAAARALGEGRIRERLLDVEGVAALGAAVGVGGHWISL